MIGIILAAGRSSRMFPNETNMHKAFLKINGICLIDNIINIFQNIRMDKIVIITGYNSHLFKDYSCFKLHNKNWRDTNIVGSLLQGLKYLTEYDAIITYSDIYYTSDLIVSLCDKKISNILIPYNTNWKTIWKTRFQNPLNDIESFKVNKYYQLLEIGQKVDNYDEIQGQYMGLLRTETIFWQDLIRIYSNLNIFKNYDITNFLNDLIKKGIVINTFPYSGKWFEFDNTEDLVYFNKVYHK